MIGNFLSFLNVPNTRRHWNWHCGAMRKRSLLLAFPLLSQLKKKSQTIYTNFFRLRCYSIINSRGQNVNNFKNIKYRKLWKLYNLKALKYIFKEYCYTHGITQQKVTNRMLAIRRLMHFFIIAEYFYYLVYSTKPGLSKALRCNINFK